MQSPSEMFVSQLLPHDRVLAAYSEIENALKARLAGLEDPRDLPTEPPGLARLLARRGLVSDETVRMAVITIVGAIVVRVRRSTSVSTSCCRPTKFRYRGR